jgi:hypothetical protein
MWIASKKDLELEKKLRRLRNERGPVRLHPQTFQALHKHRFVEGRGDGCVLSERGENWLIRFDRERYEYEVMRKLKPEHREFADRVEGWLKVFSPLTSFARIYALRVTEARLVGVEPFASGSRWGEEGDANILAWVDRAIQIVRNFDEVQEQAIREAGDVVIDFAVEDRRPHRVAERKRKARVEAELDGAVDLTAYRRERGA